MIMDGSDWRKEVENDAFVPVSYPEEKFNPVEWAHCLASIDVCSLNHGTKFCNNFGTSERHLSHNFPCGATIATSHMYTLIDNKTRILNK